MYHVPIRPNPIAHASYQQIKRGYDRADKAKEGTHKDAEDAQRRAQMKASG